MMPKNINPREEINPMQSSIEMIQQLTNTTRENLNNGLNGLFEIFNFFNENLIKINDLQQLFNSNKNHCDARLNEMQMKQIFQEERLDQLITQTNGLSKMINKKEIQWTKMNDHFKQQLENMSKRMKLTPEQSEKKRDELDKRKHSIDDKLKTIKERIEKHDRSFQTLVVNSHGYLISMEDKINEILEKMENIQFELQEKESPNSQLSQEELDIIKNEIYCQIQEQTIKTINEIIETNNTWKMLH